ncbi:MAG: hypothetical protein D6731_13440 [Planctomycetota bacterium]|nr:MAG: hypothetical protein D6731_13440 [Planctomycetota bacterium]
MCAPLPEETVPAIGRGPLHDTLLLRLLDEARPLPESVSPTRVRALRRSEAMKLVREVLAEQLGAWEARVEALYADLAQARSERSEEARRAAAAEADRDALAGRVRRLEGDLSAAHRAAERHAAERESLLRAGARRLERIAELERALAQAEAACPDAERAELQRSLERARASGRAAARRSLALRCERDAIRAEAEARADRIAALEARCAQLREAAAASAQRSHELQDALGQAQRAFEEAWALSRAQDERIGALLAELEARDRQLAWQDAVEASAQAAQDELAERRAQAEALRRERELLSGALATARDVLEQLRGELARAREVQRLSRRLGTLMAPPGAEHLRVQRPEFVLFAELHTAQEGLKDGHRRLEALERRLGAIAEAVADETAGARWLEAELAKTRLELSASQERAAELERERWSVQEALEARTAEAASLERELLRLQTALADAERRVERALEEASDRAALERELSAACEELEAREVLCAAAQAQLTLARTRLADQDATLQRERGEALRALEEADAERARLEAALAAEAQRAGQLELKVERLLVALHRDRTAG